jgi:hypothetical protein
LTFERLARRRHLSTEALHWMLLIP